MTINQLYLGAAFGWETESTAKVAISQLREKGTINAHKCPRAILARNESGRWMPNTLKIVGYVPILNIVAGIIAIVFSEPSDKGLDPNHTASWIGRGIAMIVCGPLLIIVDIVKYIFDSEIVDQYNHKNPDLIKAFDTDHEHSPAYWPGHPVFCEN